MQRWYIPIEPWNFKRDIKKTAMLRTFLAPIAARCHALSGGEPVALAPYFNPGLASSSETRDVYTEVLRGTKIDVSIDGVDRRRDIVPAEEPRSAM
jgi:hypothetical protein